AVEGLDFTVPTGQFACILGPSGCGKTTSLSIIAGLDRDYRGVVNRSGRSLGMVFQMPRLMPWLTARENVRRGINRAPRGPGRAEDMLVEMQLGPFLDAFPRQLSGGQQRRVALARAFVNDPDLLLLDEPFLSLDAPTAQHLRELLLSMCERRHPTILCVTEERRGGLGRGAGVLFRAAGRARVALDLPLALPRPRHPDDARIDAVRARLLESHPDLLRGLTAGGAAYSVA